MTTTEDGLQRLRRARHVVDERHASGAVQHLWQRRLHPRAFAGGKYNDVEVGRESGGRHGLSLPSATGFDAAADGRVRRPEHLAKRLEVVEGAEVRIL